MQHFWSSVAKSLAHAQTFYAFVAVVAVCLILNFIADYKIVKKTGNSGLFSLLFYVPLFNVLLWMALAFGEWPKRES